VLAGVVDVTPPGNVADREDALISGVEAVRVPAIGRGDITQSWIAEGLYQRC